MREQGGTYCKAVGVVVRRSKGTGKEAPSRTPGAEMQPVVVCATEPTSAGDTWSIPRERAAIGLIRAPHGRRNHSAIIGAGITLVTSDVWADRGERGRRDES